MKKFYHHQHSIDRNLSPFRAGRSPVVPAGLYLAVVLGLLSLAGSTAFDKKKLAETNAARYIIDLPDGIGPPALKGGF